MTTIYSMRANGQISVGYARAKIDGALIFAFRRWGKLNWCGDGVNFRATKSEAFADARKGKPCK
jgi:hypothetical protein